MININSIKKIYFIGIKGVAMSGLAVICKQRGLTVFGSDVPEKFITDKILIDNDIEVFENFSAQNMSVDPDLVVIGASWGSENVEVAECHKRKIPTISDSELRGILSREKRTIAVTGVHGKTTTTALVAHVFRQARLDPSFLIGTGQVPDLKSNAAWSTGAHFIVEGDEYIRAKNDTVSKFLDLDPAISIITSLEWEHVDVFPDLASLEKSFAQLIEKTKNVVVACGDWPSVRKIIANQDKTIVTYGLGDDNMYVARDIIHEFNKTTFRLFKSGEEIGKFETGLFGVHNVLNCCAAIIVGLMESVSLEQIRVALLSFKGTERRFDVSEKNGIIFVDDYGHHPTEIKTTLEAVRHRYPDKKIWCVFQPHMVSRTKALLSDFTRSFNSVDRIIFADIFASAREQGHDFTSEHLAQATKINHPDVVYAGDLNQTINYLKERLEPGTVLVTMGAGDVYRVRDKLI
ncbi:MAG: UDP-N-acetylmuramate--L-alanine ligase [Candidatus Buchananbacteria bacterium]|nr:UDP-N-acetylmuramate--L-alanine ligase [Candidatus Buchananbacteria bacterium]